MSLNGAIAHSIIEGASHTMPVDHPDAVVEAVREVVEAARATAG